MQVDKMVEDILVVVGVDELRMVMTYNSFSWLVVLAVTLDTTEICC